MSKGLKYTLLLLLSLTSVFFAEVIAGSSKFPLYDFWGIIVVIPLYGLHTIILLYIIKRYLKNRKVMFATLYFAGTIFGLYEAYLTKVLWVGLSPDSIIVCHIALIDFLVLVFMWHPLMSFIIPVLVFEGFMTKDKYLFSGLPNFVKKGLQNKWWRILLFVVLGLFFSLNGISPINVLLSGTLNAIPILLLYYLLRKKEVHLKYTLQEILPNKKEIKVCIVILIVMYIVMGIFIHGDVLSFKNQIVIWIIYIILGSIFYIKLKNNKLVKNIEIEKKEINYKYMIVYTLILILTGSLFAIHWIFGIRDVITMVVFIIWAGFGIIVFIYALIKKI